MLAVLEHLERPIKITKEIERILKQNGKLILTVPGRNAKPVLEFLANTMKIFSEDEINAHKKYYKY